MAALTNDSFGKMLKMLGRLCAQAVTDFPSATKSQYNLAFQTIEDFWENNKAQLNSDMDTNSGFSFSIADKKRMMKCWLTEKIPRAED
ncbi:MAG: hypothetical protein ACYTE8_02340 [Planctomycetota bacterium]|jgi:hypothetical protein